MWIFIGIGIIVILIVYFLFCFNKFIKLNNMVKEAFSTMDVYLKKRWDLIPNLVEVVKGYAKHESDTLDSVIKLRSNTYDNMSDEDKLRTNEQISSSICKIMMLAESYPDLKANENFKNLSNQLVKIEDDIANSRKYYNATVRIYNNKVEMFPSNIVAKITKYKTKAMFEVFSSERENVKIDLN